MKRLLAFVIPFSLVVGVGIGAKLWFATTGGLSRGEPIDAALEELPLETPFVRVRGMAHYPVIIKQHVPGSLFYDEQTFYLFPLFAPNDTSTRGVRVLVRAPRRPDALVDFEHMVVEGFVGRVTPDKVPFSTEIDLGKRTDYWFTDDMVLLEAWRIESDGVVWELPE